MNPVEVQLFSKVFETKERPLFRKVPRSLVAVDRTSFSVAKGEIFGLLGPNGAGKTTTIKMLCTRITPTSADALVNKFSVMKDQQKVRESLGVMLTAEANFVLEVDRAREPRVFRGTVPRATILCEEAYRGVAGCCGFEGT